MFSLIEASYCLASAESALSFNPDSIAVKRLSEAGIEVLRRFPRVCACRVRRAMVPTSPKRERPGRGASGANRGENADLAGSNRRRRLVRALVSR
jgi:hypothetical protein